MTPLDEAREALRQIEYMLLVGPSRLDEKLHEIAFITRAALAKLESQSHE